MGSGVGVALLFITLVTCTSWATASTVHVDAQQGSDGPGCGAAAGPTSCKSLAFALTTLQAGASSTFMVHSDLNEHIAYSCPAQAAVELQQERADLVLRLSGWLLCTRISFGPLHLAAHSLSPRLAITASSVTFNYTGLFGVDLAVNSTAQLDVRAATLSGNASLALTDVDRLYVTDTIIADNTLPRATGIFSLAGANSFTLLQNTSFVRNMHAPALVLQPTSPGADLRLLQLRLQGHSGLTPTPNVYIHLTPPAGASLLVDQARILDNGVSAEVNTHASAFRVDLRAPDVRVNVTRSEFARNWGGFGAGLHVHQSVPARSLSITHNCVHDNGAFTAAHDRVTVIQPSLALSSGAIHLLQDFELAPGARNPVYVAHNTFHDNGNANYISNADDCESNVCPIPIGGDLFLSLAGSPNSEAAVLEHNTHSRMHPSSTLIDPSFRFGDAVAAILTRNNGSLNLIVRHSTFANMSSFVDNTHQVGLYERRFTASGAGLYVGVNPLYFSTLSIHGNVSMHNITATHCVASSSGGAFTIESIDGEVALSDIRVYDTKYSVPINVQTAIPLSAVSSGTNGFAVYIHDCTNVTMSNIILSGSQKQLRLVWIKQSTATTYMPLGAFAIKIDNPELQARSSLSVENMYATKNQIKYLLSASNEISVGDNDVMIARGSALSVSGVTYVTVRNSRFEDNTIEVTYDAVGATPVTQKDILLLKPFVAGLGAAIHLAGGRKGVIEHVQMHSNRITANAPSRKSKAGGAGLFADFAMDVDDLTCTGNTAYVQSLDESNGAGGCMLVEGATNLRNSLVESNQVVCINAIANEPGAPLIALAYCLGGGVLVSGDLDVRNTVVRGNSVNSQGLKPEQAGVSSVCAGINAGAGLVLVRTDDDPRNMPHRMHMENCTVQVNHLDVKCQQSAITDGLMDAVGGGVAVIPDGLERDKYMARRNVSALSHFDATVMDTRVDQNLITSDLYTKLYIKGGGLVIQARTSRISNVTVNLHGNVVVNNRINPSTMDCHTTYNIQGGGVCVQLDSASLVADVAVDVRNNLVRDNHIIVRPRTSSVTSVLLNDATTAVGGGISVGVSSVVGHKLLLDPTTNIDQFAGVYNHAVVVKDNVFESNSVVVTSRCNQASSELGGGGLAVRVDQTVFFPPRIPAAYKPQDLTNVTVLVEGMQATKNNVLFVGTTPTVRLYGGALLVDLNSIRVRRSHIRIHNVTLDGSRQSVAPQSYGMALNSLEMYGTAAFVRMSGAIASTFSSDRSAPNMNNSIEIDALTVTQSVAEVQHHSASLLQAGAVMVQTKSVLGKLWIRNSRWQENNLGTTRASSSSTPWVIFLRRVIGTALVVTMSDLRMDMLMEGCVFQENVSGVSSPSALGAVYVDITQLTRAADLPVDVRGMAFSVDIRGCLFDSNVSGKVGGLFLGVLGCRLCTVSVHNCTFASNVANSTNAGGLMVKSLGSASAGVTESATPDVSDLKVNITRTHFVGNRATSGGAGMLLVGSNTTMDSCVFENNRVPSGRGGAAVLLGTHLIMNNVMMHDNVASKSEAVFLDEASTLRLSSDSKLTSSGRSDLVSYEKPNDVFPPVDQTYAGKMGPKSTEGHYLCPLGSPAVQRPNDISCEQCPFGTYSVTQNNRPCHVCRATMGDVGVVCPGGSNVTVLTGYQGMRNPYKPDQLVLLTCLGGLCCQNASCAWNESCAKDRNVSVAYCGACNGGFSEVLGSEGCVLNEQCTSGVGLMVMCVLMGLVFVMVQLLLPRTSHDGSPKDLKRRKLSSQLKSALFLLQMAPLVVDTDKMGFVKAASKIADLRLLDTLALLQHHEGLPNGGLCVWPNMTSIEKLAVGYVLPAILLAICVVVALLVGMFRRRLGKGRLMAMTNRLVLTFLDVLLLVYSSLTKTTSQLLECRRLDPLDPQSPTVIARAGAFLCDGTRFQLMAALLSIFLVSFPFLLFLAAMDSRGCRARGDGSDSESDQEGHGSGDNHGTDSMRLGLLAHEGSSTDIAGSLNMAADYKAAHVSGDLQLPWRDVVRTELRVHYRDNRWWYESVFIARRLVLITVASVIVDAATRAMVMIIATNIQLLAHVLVWPFTSYTANVLELVSLGMLCVMAGMHGMAMLRPELVLCTGDTCGPLVTLGFVLVALISVLFLVVVVQFLRNIDWSRIWQLVEERRRGREIEMEAVLESSGRGATTSNSSTPYWVASTDRTRQESEMGELLAW